MIETIFWASLIVIFYTYIGYGLVLYALVSIKRLLAPKGKPANGRDDFLPSVTILVAAYNEADVIAEKIANTLRLDYPKEKIKYLFVTDGSDDGTPDIIAQYSDLQLLHQPEREGKTKALHRGMSVVETSIVILTDANTLLNPEAIRKIVGHYQNEKVGAVAGEKRIIVEESDQASRAGEGLYWRYESALKKMDSELCSVVGAAGELFSFRTKLYEYVPDDTIIEDFYLSLKIASKGYMVKYEPDAYAYEKGSASIREELKRKVRISAGGFQAIVRLVGLLNIFKHGFLSFQYFSHRVLRWTLAPLSLLFLFLSNIFLSQSSFFYFIFLLCQIFFYLMAFAGGIISHKKIRLKAFFMPWYFLVMNYAVFAGFARYIQGKQSVLWEKAERA